MPAPLTRWGVLLAAMMWAPTTQAADLVIHATEDVDAVLTQVSEDADVERTSLRAANISDLLLTRAPVLVGSGRVDRCAGSPTTNDDVRGAAEVAEGSMAFMEYEQAVKDLDVAYQALGCLVEAVDGAVAGRILFLRGIALYHSRDLQPAKAAFRQAHLFDPALVWDDNYAPDPRPLFEGARIELADAPKQALQVIPGAEVAQLHVDGRRIGGDVTLSPGDHLVQVGGARVATVQVHLEAGETATLLLPSVLPPGAVAWPDDADLGGDLSTLLGAVLGKGFVVYVVYEEHTWCGTTGAPEWEMLSEEPVAEVPEPEPEVPETAPMPISAPPKAKKKHPVWWLTAPGGVAMVTGLGVSGFAYVRGKQDYRAAEEATTREQYDEVDQHYEEWRAIHGIGWLVTAGGAVLVGASMLGFVDAEVGFAPWLGPDGGGLTVTVGSTGKR
ncbi:MAG: hypothetical protein JRI25_01380 [Deltaproteobacteria bacterium]|nr:hypothetical protein [Deltaproteobacteria bacterium]MBW2253231.1 hypothetical protein [Deltaproteobacteria bacterium]